MLIDFQKPILDLKGKPIPNNPKNPSDGSLLLKDVCQNSLTATYNDEPQLQGREKVKRSLLALKIEEATLPLDLSTEDSGMIKSLVDKMYGSWIYFRVDEIFEASHSEKPKEA